MTTGNILKMRTTLGKSSDQAVQYELPIGDEFIALNPLIGKTISIKYNGTINCVHCGKKTNKSYSQGHCFPCMKKLASCDMCIMKPETCHFDNGTCREPDWGLAHCMKPHYVYLANSSGLKVGITRETQIPIRWMDQGAVEALPIAKVQTRLQVGLMEVMFKDHVNDKTNWRKMLTNTLEDVDIFAKRDELLDLCKDGIADLKSRFGDENITVIPDAEVVDISYPVEEYPVKVKSHNFDKTPEVSGVLNGIKGQYLLLDSGVLNLRKFSGYELTFDVL